MLAPVKPDSGSPESAPRESLQTAIAHHRAGRLDAAHALYQTLLDQSPNNPALLHLMGTLAGQTGQFQRSAALIGQAIARDATQPLYYWNLAHALRSAGQTQAAIEALHALLACDPAHAQATGALVDLLLAVGRPAQALLVCESAWRHRPGQPDVAVLLGNACAALQRWEQAHAHYRQAIAGAPTLARAYTGQAGAYIGQQDWHAALASLRTALALAPADANTWFRQGVVLQALGHAQEAIGAYSQAIRFKPGFALAYTNRGNVLQGAGDFDSALADYDAALACDRGCAAAHWNKGLLLLLQGAYAQAWPLHEWRWQKDEMRAAKPCFAQPQWNGSQPVQDKTVLLVCEQGLGDSIQFVRYASMLSAQGARVIVRAPRTLVALFSTMDPGVQCIADDAPLPAFDYFCPLMSLPLAFGTELASVPAKLSYLHADPTLIADWQQRLGPQRKPRVGIVCSGSPHHANDAARSLALAQWMRHLPRGCEYISLQNLLRPEDMRYIQRSSAVLYVGNQLPDLAATAALCACVDIVLSVDTSVAHLAGAMGKPTCLLLPALPDWRWLLERTDSPWYPTLTLYRQHTQGQWEPVLERLGQDLAARLRV